MILGLLSWPQERSRGSGRVMGRMWENESAERDQGGRRKKGLEHREGLASQRRNQGGIQVYAIWGTLFEKKRI